MDSESRCQKSRLLGFWSHHARQDKLAVLHQSARVLVKTAFFISLIARNSITPSHLEGSVDASTPDHGTAAIKTRITGGLFIAVHLRRDLAPRQT